MRTFTVTIRDITTTIVNVVAVDRRHALVRAGKGEGQKLSAATKRSMIAKEARLGQLPYLRS